MSRPENETEIVEGIEKVRELVMQNGDGSRYRQEMEQCVSIYNTNWNGMQGANTQRDYDSHLAQCNTLLWNTSCTINELLLSIQKVIKLLEDENEGVLRMISPCLAKWKHNQIVSTRNYSLNVVQNWFNSLAELIRITITLIDAMLSTPLPDLLTNHLTDFNAVRYDALRLLQTLFMQAFIVFEQPRQVMKKDTKYDEYPVTVRLLLTNIPELFELLPVTVSIISEANARMAPEIAQPSGKLSNNTGQFPKKLHGHRLVCSLSNLRVKSINRADKKNYEAVTEEKFTFLFQSTINIYGTTINIWVMSLPIVVIAHVNQEPKSWATIVWDNANFEVGRDPFAIQDKVPWSRIELALNMRFLSQTGRGLTPTNLDYLRRKAFRGKGEHDSKEYSLTWNEFCKTPLLNLSFTFWDFFYGAMKLISRDDQLRDLWTGGHITGFIERDIAVRELQNCRSGTFLLRFSENECGCITIDFVEHLPETSIQSYGPLHYKHLLSKHTLANSIMDLKRLQFLCPNTPKENVFKKSATRSILRAGYVLLKLTAIESN